MGKDRGQPTIVRKEMGITHEDFYAELPALLNETPYQQSADTIRFKRHGKRIEIALGPEGGRQIGHSMRLPVTPVEIRFFDLAEQEMGDFVRHFNLRFMKGGG